MPAMRAMVPETPGTALVMRERLVPAPGLGGILIEIAACAGMTSH
jgi:D-arabinose 1-dehydrogenase-like Zn-dependent alcohol dehydrogenase